MYRLSWDPSLLSPSAMLPPFRDATGLPRIWNRVTELRDIAPARIAALRELRLVFAGATAGAHLPAALERLAAAEAAISLHTIEAPTLDALASTLDDDAALETIVFVEPASLRTNDPAEVDRLFDGYRCTINELALNHPAVRLIAMTMPLAAGAELSIGRMVARSLGRDREFERNCHRNRFNRLLLDEFTGRMPIFDVARLESTRPDGTRAFEFDGGDPVYVLAPEYADADGRLNETAERLFGEQVVVFLAGLPAAPSRVVGVAR